MIFSVIKQSAAAIFLAMTVPTAAMADWAYYTGVTQQRQDMLEWCWASVARAVLKHNKGVTREQCRLASQYKAGQGYSDYCCTGGNSTWGRPIASEDRKAVCNQPHTLHDVLGEFDAYEGFVDHPDGPEGVSGVERQLRENTPPIASISWPNGGAHAITIVSGTNADNLTNYEIYDPWTGRAWTTRANLKTYQTIGKWTQTIHTK